WRIVKRTAVYEKDRLEPVDPRGVPKDFFDDMELSAFPTSAKFLCYRQLRSGRSPSTNIISAYSDEERALREEGEAWLENGGSPFLRAHSRSRLAQHGETKSRG